MNILLKSVSVIVLAAIGAGGVLYMDSQCPKKKAAQKAQVEETVAQYINNNPQVVLEKIAKTEEFAQAVRNFSNINEQALHDEMKRIIENNPDIIENYVRSQAGFIAANVLNTDEFKNVSVQPQAQEQTEEAQENTSNSAYKEHWNELTSSEVAPSVGPKDAKVTVVEFFDFACGHCKALAPVMSRLIKDNPDVRFIFNPLYFISAASPYAAKVSMAAAKKGKFAEVFDGIMTLPELNEDAINQILVDEGLNVDEIKTMIEEKSIRRGLQDIDSISQVLGVNGVPMIIINGEDFYGRSFEDLQNKINSLK